MRRCGARNRRRRRRWARAGAHTACAGVASCPGVAVVASRAISHVRLSRALAVRVLTGAGDLARVRSVGTHHAITWRRRRDPSAHACRTHVIVGTGIAVVAGSSVVRVRLGAARTVRVLACTGDFAIGCGRWTCHAFTKRRRWWRGRDSGAYSIGANVAVRACIAVIASRSINSIRLRGA